MPDAQTPAQPSSARRASRRYFTIDQANRALALVRRVAEDVVQQYRRVVEKQEELERLEDKDKVEAANEARDQLVDEVDKLQRLFEELNEVGVELKEPSIGLLDFPAMHKGREIYLCWKVGEGNVSHWHELDAGYAGRQPADELD